jgi:hypothetical protein
MRFIQQDEFIFDEEPLSLEEGLLSESDSLDQVAEESSPPEDDFSGLYFSPVDEDYQLPEREEEVDGESFDVMNMEGMVELLDPDERVRYNWNTVVMQLPDDYVPER